MLALILGFITGLAGPLAQVINKITDLKQAQVKASSDEELADINSQLEQVHDRKAVLIAEAGNRVAAIYNAVTRGAVMWLFVIPILAKFAYDKVMGSLAGCGGRVPINDISVCYKYSTDALDPNMWWVIIAAIGFYFLTTWKK